MQVSPLSPERVGAISRTSFRVTLPTNLDVTSALLKVMGQHHVPVALLGGWEGGVEGMQRIRGMGHRASM
jgi:UDP-N-acetyl-D-mannosaminuronic acid transferase (WecB/TagA/CpsF family)